jgi:uncharacterized membrane protein
MSVNITSIVTDGANRSTKRNGLMLMGILLVLSVISGLLGTGVTQYIASQQFALIDIQSTPAIVLPPVIAGVLALVIGLATLVVNIGAIRVFVSNETERLPREYFTQNMVWAALNLIVGGVVFGIVVTLGFVALVIPGIFLLVTLAFWSVYVAVEDQNFIESFSSSWGLTRGHRFSLFLLGIAVLLVAVIINIVFSIGGVAGVTAGFVLAQVGTAITSVFSAAVLAAAYNELTALPDEDGTHSVDEETIPPKDSAETM